MTRDFGEREKRRKREEAESRGGQEETEDRNGASRRALLGATAAVATTGALGAFGSLGTAKQREDWTSRTQREGQTGRAGRIDEQAGGAAKAKRAFRFGGRVQGWYGRAPMAINGYANPTLRLEPGVVYEVTWENLDGAPHNFAFRDADENFLPVILPEGADVEATSIANATGGNTTDAIDGNATTTMTGETTGTRTTQSGTTQFPENGIEQTDIIREQGDDQSFYFVAVEEIAEYLCVVHPERMDGEVSFESAAQTTAAGEGTPTETG